MKFSEDDAQNLISQLGIKDIDPKQFLIGINIELEHGSKYPECNVTNDDPQMTAKITWAHLKEIPDYYTRLSKMESDAKTMTSIDEMAQLFSV